MAKLDKLKAMMMGAGMPSKGAMPMKGKGMENAKDMAKDKKMGIKENKVESKEYAKKKKPFAKKK